jgi:hypothetical protein
LKRGESGGSAVRPAPSVLPHELALSSAEDPYSPASKDRTRSSRTGKTLEALAGIAIVGYVIYALLQAKLFNVSIDPNRFRDLGILFELSRRVFESGSYVGYYFPPSNAVLIHLFASLGKETAFRLHLILQASAFFVTLYVWSSFVGIAHRPDRIRIAFCAVLATLFYVRFEFHMHNVNLLTLGLVSLSLYWLQRPVLGGAAYALNIAIKPYGATLLLPWMLWSRRFRWSTAAAVWCLVFVLLLPVIWFGPREAVRLFGEWLTAVQGTALEPGRLSLSAGFAALAGGDPNDPAIRQAARLAEVAWLCAVGVFLWPSLRRPAREFGYAMACDIAALLLAPLPLGGWQQPARGIVILVPMLFICAAIFDRNTSSRARVALILIAVLVGTLPRLIAAPEIFAVATLAVCAALLAGLAIARASQHNARHRDTSALAAPLAHSDCRT